MGNRESEPQYTVATIRILKALPCGLYLPGLGGDGLKEPGDDWKPRRPRMGADLCGRSVTIVGIKVAALVLLLNVLPALSCSSAMNDRPDSGKEHRSAEQAARISVIVEVMGETEDRARERYGFERCEPHWLQVVRTNDIDGDYATSILSRDMCANLGVEIAALARESDPILRRRSAEMLGRLRAEGSASLLQELVGDADENVASQALRSLCVIAPGPCVESRLTDIPFTGPWGRGG
jgi:hypothetical protein